MKGITPMKVRNVLLSTSLALAAGIGGAPTVEAQSRPPLPALPGLTCENFKQNADGSWTPTREVTIVGPNGPFTVGPGEVFRVQLEGTTNYNVKIAKTLDEICR
jgi:hypothetical protein